MTFLASEPVRPAGPTAGSSPRTPISLAARACRVLPGPLRPPARRLRVAQHRFIVSPGMSRGRTMAVANTPVVRRNEIIGVLSLAVDFAIGQPVGYGLRSAAASRDLARAMGGDEEAAAEAYYQGLLQACGCNAETDVLNALFGDEIKA